MPSQEDIIEIAKLAGVVNSAMNDLESKTDSNQRKWIPVRKVDINSVLGSEISNQRTESIPVNINNMPNLAPKPLTDLLIPSLQQQSKNDEAVNIKAENPNQLKFDLDFTTGPNVFTIKMLLDSLDVINSKLTEILKINRDLYERKSQRRKKLSN